MLSVLTIRLVVLISGSLSIIGSIFLVVLLLWWLKTLRDLAGKSLNVTIRSTICHFMLHLVICDLFSGFAYVASFFTDLIEKHWFCILQGGLMVIFEYAGLLWTAGFAYLLWR